MSKLPQIGSLWIGAELSWLEQLCLLSFAEAGHHVTLYSYQPISNLPAGIHAEDAAVIYGSETILRHARTGSPAIHADLWRLHLLKKTEKIWVDADMYCYRPFAFDREYVFGWEKPGLICNAVLGLPKDSLALKGLLAFFEDEYAIAPWLKPWQQRDLESAKAAGRPVHMTEQDWGFTGPAAVTWFLEKTGESSFAEPEAAFYPIAFRDRNKMIQKKFDIAGRLTQQTKGVHFWARRMKPRLEEKENNRPRSGSFLDRLIQKHGIDPSAALIPRKQSLNLQNGPSTTVNSGPTAVLLNGLGTQRAMRIVDIGTNQTSPPIYQSLLAQGGCEVVGFQPHPEALASLQQAKSNLETYSAAVIGDGGEVVLNVFREVGSTSIYRPRETVFDRLGVSKDSFEIVQQIETETHRLDDLDEVTSFDVLILNTQGAELQVCKGARNKLSDAVVVVQRIRFHPLFENEPIQGEVEVALRQNGFQLHKIMFQKGGMILSSEEAGLSHAQNSNQIMTGTGVFVRSLDSIEIFTNEQLKYLAIAATSIFDSYDLALFCLDQLAKRKAIPVELSAKYIAALPPEAIEHA